MWIEFSLMPSITDKLVSKNVVRKSEFDDVVKEREQYFDQYEEQRKNVRLFSKTLDEQTEQIKQKNEDLLKQSDTISNTIQELHLTKEYLEDMRLKNKSQAEQIEQLNNSLNNLQKNNDIRIKQLKKFEDLFFNPESLSFYSSYDKFPPTIIDKVKELKTENKWESFLLLGNFFQNGGSIGGQVLTDMIDKQLAFERGSREGLTPIRKIIWNYSNRFKDL